MDGVKMAKLSAENQLIYNTIYQELTDMNDINMQRVSVI